MPEQLQDSVNWVSGYVQGMPVSAFTGLNPAVQIASMVRSTILSPPFTWAFNRSSVVFNTVAGQQDYPQTQSGIANFGFVEKASANDGTTSWQIPDVINTQPLSISTTQARPMVMAVQTQVPGTSVSFRFAAVPDAIYGVEVIYQAAPVLFAALTDTWAPLPDGYGFIYNNLFLGEILADSDDPRAQLYRQRGIAALLSRSQGLSGEDKAVFMTQYLAIGTAMMNPTGKLQQATQARSV
jgi:hypothetical protein